MDDIRLKIQKLAENQKVDPSWVELASLLEEVKREKLFREWGLRNFSAYCSADLHFGRSVASDMINGRKFVQNNFPESFSSVVTEKLPGYNEIAMLRRAEDKIPEKDFERLKAALFNNEITRDQLRVEIKALSPPKESRSESIEELTAEIRRLRNKVQQLETELRYSKNKGGLNGFSQEYLKKLYRGIVRHVHPDKGGDTEVAQQVNDFFSQLVN